MSVFENTITNEMEKGKQRINERKKRPMITITSKWLVKCVLIHIDDLMTQTSCKCFGASQR